MGEAAGGVIVWPGWVGGAAVGVFVAGFFWLSGKALGVSSAYGNACGLALGTPYFRRGRFGPGTRWRLYFALGLVLGGAIGALSGGHWEPTFHMGRLYERVLPEALWARGAVLALGGVMVGYGARAAGGCQSGHAITGLALLNPPSLLAAAGFFAGGVAAVQLLFGLLS